MSNLKPNNTSINNSRNPQISINSMNESSSSFNSSYNNTDNSICSKETEINTSGESINIYLNPPPSVSKMKIITAINDNLIELIQENFEEKKNEIFTTKKDSFTLSSKPPILLIDYIIRVFKYSKMEISSLIIAVIYMDKYCVMKKLILSMKNVFKLFCVACLISIKFNEDKKVNMKEFSDIAGIDIKELLFLEQEMCYGMKFLVFVSSDDYLSYFDYFSKYKKNKTNNNKNNDGINLKNSFNSNG